MEWPVPLYPQQPKPDPQWALAQALWGGLQKDAQDFGGMLQGMWQGATAPGKALAGEYDQREVSPDGSVSMTDPRMIGDANNLAGLVMGGAMPIPKAPNSLGMFGGVMARTADKQALAQAEEMLAKGASRDEIWNATGWFKGTDGKWRFEIDDSKAKLGPKALEELMAHGGASYGATQRRVAGVLHHGDLYDAYPELRQIDVDARYNANSGMAGGSYDHAPSGNGGRPRIDAEASALEGGPESLRGLLLHELQHGTQAQEGFARGGSPYDNSLALNARDMASKAEEIYAALGDDLVAFQDEYLKANGIPDNSPDRSRWFMKAANEWAKKFPEKKQARDSAAMSMELRGPRLGYRHLAGEVEARNVQKRMDMDAAARRATPPWMTQDVPDPLQIVRFGAGAVAKKPRLST